MKIRNKQAMNRIDFNKFQVNQEQQEITFSCCSDKPYQRYQDGIFYDQILVISEDSVDLTRLNNFAPVLFNHNPDRLLGTVEKAWIIENKIFVKVKFSKNDDFAVRIYKDILDGVVKNISIGYQILDYQDTKENGKNKRYIKQWMIFETSVVSIPADDSVGIRSIKEIQTMETEEIKKEIPAETEEIQESAETEKTEKTELEQLKEKVAELEAKISEKEIEKTEDQETEKTETEEIQESEETKNEDAEEIEKIGADFEVPEEQIRSAIKEKLTIREFKNKIKSINFNKKEINKMNTKRDFTAFLQKREFGVPFAVRDFNGFGGATGGTGLIGSETLPLVEVIKKRLALNGITTLSGLTGNVSVPVQTGRIAVEKVGMNDAAAGGKPEFKNVTLSPVKFTGNVTIGADLLTQCNDDISAFVMASLLSEISRGVEDYVLGKVAEGAKQAVTYSAINAITWADVLAMEAKLSAFELDNVSFIMSAGARASLKGIEKAQGTAQFICDGENKINGYACGVSGAVANDNIYFADWSKVMLCEWGGMNVVVDPYSGADSGAVRIVASVGIDAVLLNSEAAVIGKVQA